MKSFKEYLIEGIEEKVYSFKIKIAGELPDNCEDVMETALKKYDVAKFSKSKSVPIQSKAPDFPTMENIEVCVFEVDLKYPTTSNVLHSYMSEQTGLPADRIKVRTSLEETESEINADMQNEDTTDKKSLIAQAEFPASNNQKTVGDKHVASLLKELSKNRNEATQYKGVNDALLAKKLPKEKSPSQDKLSPSKSPIGSGKGKTK
jgi:hypothetical protein